jgi:ABC-type ATPase involved in cell division
MDVVFNRVGKRFGQRDALADLSFELKSGEMAFLTGHSGAGKVPYCGCYCSSREHRRAISPLAVHRFQKSNPRASRSTGVILALFFRITNC